MKVVHKWIIIVAILASSVLIGILQNQSKNKESITYGKIERSVKHKEFFTKVSADTIKKKKNKGIFNNASPFPNVKISELQISSGMGWRTIRGIEYHQGWDLPAVQGTPVLATNSGVVSYVGFLPDQGNVVEIYFQESDTAIFFQHLESITVEKGQSITKGQQIGTVGGTGDSPDYNSYPPHLHVSAFKNASKYINNEYPMPLLPTNSETAAMTDYVSPAKMFGISDNQNNWVDEQTNLYGADSKQPTEIPDGNTMVTIGQALKQAK